jgi:hypothetical protein
MGVAVVASAWAKLRDGATKEAPAAAAAARNERLRIIRVVLS